MNQSKTLNKISCYLAVNKAEPDPDPNTDSVCPQKEDDTRSPGYQQRKESEVSAPQVRQRQRSTSS